MCCFLLFCYCNKSDLYTKGIGICSLLDNPHRLKVSELSLSEYIERSTHSRVADTPDFTTLEWMQGLCVGNRYKPILRRLPGVAISRERHAVDLLGVIVLP